MSDEEMRELFISLVEAIESIAANIEDIKIMVEEASR